MSTATMIPNGRPAADEALLAELRDLVAETGEVPTQNRIRTRLKVGNERARRLRGALLDHESVPSVPGRTPVDIEPNPSADNISEPVYERPSKLDGLVGAPIRRALVDQPDGRPEPVPVTGWPAPDGPVAAARRGDAERSPGRLLAWTALLVALAASVAANVAYARHGMGPRLSAGTAPLLVVLAAGLLERVPLRGARWWQRWLAVGGLVFVVLAAFITSYQHQSALLLAYGNPKLSSVLLPFAVDALIVMSSVCLAVIAERRRERAEAMAS
jgi:hypothetical protein